MTFYQFAPESPDGEPYGSCEIFYVDSRDHSLWFVSDVATSDAEEILPTAEGGWYWQPCFPGCLPYGEPRGPFASEEEACAEAGVAL